jgi:hypothetical protein
MSTPQRALLTLFLILTTSASSTLHEYTLNISRAKVTQALMQFSEQTGLQVGYYPDGSTDQPPVVGPLKGRYTAEAGLKSLLAHSGLVHKFLNDHTIVVMHDQGGVPLDGVSLGGATSSSVDFRSRFPIPSTRNAELRRSTNFF